MSLESRRVLRRIDAAIADLNDAKAALSELEGQELDYTSAAVDLESAGEIIAKAVELCNEQG